MEPTQKQSSGKKQTGRWSAQEHQRFMLGIFQYGKDWKKVEQVVGTRSGSQVRSHAQKFFNRLQKEQKSNRHPNQDARQDLRQNQVSQTQNDILNGIIQEEASLNTPLQIVSLIRKESGHGKTINVNSLIKKLQSEGQQVQNKKKLKTNEQKTQQKNDMLGDLQKQHNSFKSMTNILNAYQNVNQDKLPLQNQDQSFLLLLTKKYKRYFAKGGQFQNLIDLKNPDQVKNAQKSYRKRSFTLIEGQQSDQQKLDQIKKKIKLNDEQKDQAKQSLRQKQERFIKQQQQKQKQKNEKEAQQIKKQKNQQKGQNQQLKIAQKSKKQ